jgi:hypothetical protein
VVGVTGGTLSFLFEFSGDLNGGIDEIALTATALFVAQCFNRIET